MLKRLKNAVQQQQEKTTSTAADARSGDREGYEFHEGFVCPECRKTFETVDTLQKHYEQLHGIPLVVENAGEQPTVTVERNSDSQQTETGESTVDEFASFVCPQCFHELPSANELQSHFVAMHSNDTGNKDVDILAMRQEMNDLRAALKEEKRYGIEMRKEVEKIHQLMENKALSSGVAIGQTGENESMYYMQQIQMLEAGKALVTTKMLDLEKQLADSTRANEATIREKDRVLEKSLNIAREHAALKSQFDEEMSQRMARESRIHELKHRVQDLEIELDQRPSDDDVAVLRKELVHAQTLMNDMAQDKEGETSEWVEKCGQLEKTCSEQESKIFDLMAQLNDISSQKEDVNTRFLSELKDETTKRTELESTVSKLKEENLKNSNDLGKLHDTISALNGELVEMKVSNESLQADLKRANDQESHLRIDLERKSAELMESARRVEELEERLVRLTNEREDILKSIETGESAEIAITQLSTENAQLSANLRDVEQQFSSFRTESVEERSRLDMKLEEKTRIVESMQNQLSTAETERSKLLDKLSEKEKGIGELVTELEQRTDQITSLSAKLDEVNKNLEESKRFETSAHESIIKLTKIRENFEKEEEEWKQEKTDLIASLEEMKNKCHTVETRLETMIAERDVSTESNKSMTEKLEDTEKRLKQLTIEKTELLRSRDEHSIRREEEMKNWENKSNESSALLEAEKTHSRSLENTINELKEEIMQLKMSNQNIFAEKTAVVVEINDLKGKMAAMNDDQAKLKQEISDRKKEIARMNGENEAIAAAKDDQARALKEAETKAADLRAQLAKVEDILHCTREETTDIIREKQKELDKTINELNKANSEKRAIEESKSGEIELLKAERDKMEEQMEHTKKTLEERDSAYENLLATKLQMDDAVEKIGLEKDEELQAKEKKIQALLTERDMRAGEWKEANKEAEKLRADLQQAQSALADMQCKLEEEKDMASKRIVDLENQLSETRKDRERVEEESASKEKELRDQLQSLTDSLSDMRAELASKSADLESVTTKNGKLEIRLADVEEEMTGLKEEKRMLLERCLLNDRDIEEERDNCKEVKRRLDDAVAALYELGRQHQSFQIDINRFYNRKWADDAEVHNCTKCSKQFTVTIRKHHCRNCGLIFCQDCSSKTAYVTVSKKPTRVCDACYDELQSR